MGEITRQDLVTDEAYKVFKDLTKDALEFKDTVDGIKSSSKQFSDSISGNNVTTTQLKEAVQGLSVEQKALVQVQGQIATATAKQSDAYQAQLAVLKDTQAQLKQKTQLGDREAISINAQNASITQLSAALQINRAAYSALTTEEQRKSKQGQELLKVIQEQDNGFKALQQSIGKNQEEVGNYKLATEGLAKQFEGLLSKLGPSGEKIEEIGGKALSAGGMIKNMATGIVGLTTAAGAFIAASLGQYFTRTAEGARELFIVTTELEYAWIRTKDALAAVGGFLADAVKQSTLYRGALIALQLVEGKGAKDFRDNALEGRKLQKERIALSREESEQELEKSKLIFESRDKLHNSEIQRLEDAKKALVIQQQLSEASARQAEEEARNRIKSIVIESGRGSVDKLGLKDLQEVAELEIKINEARKTAYSGTRRIMAEIVQLEIEIAKQEAEAQLNLLKVSKETDNSILQSEISRNAIILGNLKSTEAEKKAAYLKDAEDEKKIAQNTGIVLLAEAEKQAIERFKAKNGEKADFNKEDVLQSDQVFQAERLKIELDFAGKKDLIDKKLKQDLIHNELDFQKRRGDAQLLYFSLTKDEDSARLTGIIQQNNKILQAEDSSYQSRASALKSNAALEIAIEKNKLDKEIASATEASKQKAATDGLDVQHKKELEKQIEKLQDDYENKVKSVNQKLLIDTKTNVFTTLARDANVLNEKISIATQQRLSDLNEELHSGNISVTKYESEKAKIILKSQDEIAKNEIANLEEQKKIVIAEGADTQTKLTEIEAKQAALRQGIAEKWNQKYLEQKKKLFQQEVALVNSAFDTIQTLSKNATDSQITDLENQLSVLQDQHDKQIELAGDNAEAKKQIDARYLADQKRIKKEENKLKHDQAVLDKELAEAKILVNTAVAITQTIAEGGYFAIPLSIIVGALGALELAKVESTPIPAYEFGTKGIPHPGGKALVGERGAELIKLPSGQINLTPNKATVLDLPRGAEVIPHPETMRRLALAGFESSMVGNSMQVNINLKEVVNGLGRVETAIKRNSNHPVSYVRVGGMIIEAHRESATHTRKVIKLSGNS